MYIYFYKAIKNADLTLLILIAGIVVFALTAIMLLSFTLIKRKRKLIKQKKTQVYAEEIEAMLFSLIFEQRTIQDVIAQYQGVQRNSLFKKLMIRSVVALHQNYTGSQKQILEQFYTTSGLAEYSFQKLRSIWWKHKVEGIRDLSALDVTEAIPEIRNTLQHQNEMVKKEALIGLISLEGISLLNQSDIDQIYIDDWSQSCILFNLKRKQQPFPEDITYLLQSRNESLVLLAARIIHFFQLYNFYQPLLQSGMQLNTVKYQQDLSRIKERIKTFISNEYN
ncbi:hypothetical protein D3C72_644610 [compost metagenome]